MIRILPHPAPLLWRGNPNGMSFNNTLIYQLSLICSLHEKSVWTPLSFGEGAGVRHSQLNTPPSTHNTRKCEL